MNTLATQIRTAQTCYLAAMDATTRARVEYDAAQGADARTATHAAASPVS